MTIESVGPYLKQVRESQGLSLDEVATLTRIQPKFLKALEEEDFAGMPGQVFARGFVRTYARSLGIDEEDVLRRFSESSGQFYRKGQEELEQARKKLEEEKRGRINRNLVIVTTVTVLIGLGYLLSQYQQVPAPSTLEPTEQATLPRPSVPTELLMEEPQPAPDASQNRTSGGGESVTDTNDVISTEATASSQAQNTGSSLTTDSSSNKPLTLELEATQLTWVVVRSDNRDPHEALLQPGNRATWEAANQFTLTLGNAGGVVVKLNGESRGPFGKPGSVVRDVVIRP